MRVEVVFENIIAKNFLEVIWGAYTKKCKRNIQLETLQWNFRSPKAEKNKFKIAREQRQIT